MTSSLLSRLEALTEPSRKIDVEIYRALVEPLAEPFKEYVGSVWTSASSSIHVPRFTASIDAALTLVPEGCDWAICLCGDSYAAVVDMDPTGYVGDLLHGPGASFAATPAIALLIAIIKAKEESKP
jgi:hypothetical protein